MWKNTHADYDPQYSKDQKEMQFQHILYQGYSITKVRTSAQRIFKKYYRYFKKQWQYFLNDYVFGFSLL